MVIHRYPQTTYFILGATPMKLVRFSETEVRVYAFDVTLTGEFLAAPDYRVALEHGHDDELLKVSSADFEKAVERMRAEHDQIAADPEAVARIYFDFDGQPILIARRNGLTPLAYTILRDTGELAWSSHHLMRIMFQNDPQARPISLAEYEQLVATIRAALPGT